MRRMESLVLRLPSGVFLLHERMAHWIVRLNTTCDSGELVLSDERQLIETQLEQARREA